MLIAELSWPVARSPALHRLPTEKNFICTTFLVSLDFLEWASSGSLKRLFTFTFFRQKFLFYGKLQRFRPRAIFWQQKDHMWLVKLTCKIWWRDRQSSCLPVACSLLPHFLDNHTASSCFTSLGLLGRLRQYCVNDNYQEYRPPITESQEMTLIFLVNQTHSANNTATPGL